MVQAIERKSRTQSIVAVVKNPAKPNIEEKPKFQATAFLVGRLHKEDDRFTTLQTAHGEFPVTGLHKQLRQWLIKHPDCDSGLWAVYPRTDTEGRIRSVFIASRRSEMLENHAAVKLSGQVAWVDSNGKIVLRICRNGEPPKGMKNHPRWKPFLVTTVGFLPGCKPGEHWELECDVESGCIVLVDGQKLKDAPRQTKRQKSQVNRSKPLKTIKENKLELTV